MNLPIKIPKTHNIETGLVSQFEFGVKPLINFTQNEMKQKIADHVNSKLSGSTPAEEYRNCLNPGQSRISPNEIVLNVIPVRKVSGSVANIDADNPTGHHNLQISMANNGDV